MNKLYLSGNNLKLWTEHYEDIGHKWHGERKWNKSVRSKRLKCIRISRRGNFFWFRTKIKPDPFKRGGFFVADIELHVSIK